MKTQCPNCKNLLEVPDDSKNKTVKCNKCDFSFEATSYLNAVVENMPKDTHEVPEVPYTTDIQPSGSSIQLFGTLLLGGGVICGIFINGMAGLIAFVGGAIIIALGCILKMLEHIAHHTEKLREEIKGKKTT